ncbi:hypothetical protein BCR36DRAFT_581272 [Piromyces finnis]|uniref:Uncharacterized protein n=1 Tax=Piromyces finnis TaxID=1754191 RepID=A0A1Y1VFM9_9FUNG|nr:hypothetical protein BCR36DRAFT_581272 [Piromyces finnis]|eukprot:ORX55226.1 hypothetical protein BCR36DRAFT_581272 [Piromyces finnis]
MEKKEGVIRLLNSSGTTVMDSVSVEYEDSFCLDTFGELIEQHQNSEPKGTKNFIIARVQTWDHKQPDKAYYSYYDAFQLNKILFQTQIYLGKKLIHRLRVLNPLTNTDIIGNVNYFIVKGKTSELKNENNDVKINVGMSDINDGKTADMGHDKEECLKTVSLKESEEKEQEKVKEMRIPELTIELAKDMENGNSLKSEPISPRKKKALPKINTTLASASNDAIIPPSPSVLAVESGGVGSWTIASPAIYECKDENLPKKVWIKRKLSMLTPSTKTTFNRKSIPLGEIPETNNNYESTSAMIQPNEKKIDTAVSDQPTLEHTAITTIPVGTVTQFAKPVPQDQVLKIVPPTIKGRRRSLSYLNTLSATPKSNCSLREWLVYMKKESMKLDEDSENEKKDYDSVDIGKNKPKEVDIASAPPIIDEMEEVKKDNSSDVSDIDLDMYDAVLFATDDDFLEKSKIRAIFKKNAVTADDAKLFEMPEYKGATNYDDGQLLLYDDATLCDICFPEPPPNVTGFKAIIFQYRYILISLIIIGIFIPIFLIKT